MKRSAVLLAAALALTAAGVTAQAPKAFEVASIKPSTPTPADIMAVLPMLAGLGSFGMRGNGHSLVTLDRPALLTAIQEQLGLTLDAQRGPVDTVVIDHVEAPSPD